MATGDTDPAKRLPEPVVDDILSSERRLLALKILVERDDPIVIDDLAAAVRAREQAIDQASVERAERQAVRDEFFAEHLPKLTATGVVDYDSMLGTLALTDDERVSDHLS